MSNTALRRDDSWFEEIVSKYEARLFRIVNAILYNEHDAEEVLQDTFVTVYNKIETFEGKSQFGSWITRIAINNALMRLRKNAQEKAFPGTIYLQLLEEWCNGGLLLEDNKQKTEDRLLINELQESVLQILDTMPKHYKRVFIHRIFECLSNPETADIMGVTRASVKCNMHRARVWMREMLKV